MSIIFSYGLSLLNPDKICPDQTSEIINNAIAVLSTLAGFTLAGYTIILPLGELPRMKENEGKPYYKLCGTFTMTILIQVMPVGFIFIWKLLSCQEGVYIIVFGVLLALLLTINLLFHLHSIRTIIMPLKNKLK